MQEDSLKKRYSVKLLANIISGVIGAILIAVVPKALGPNAYGYFIYLQDFFIKIIGFLDMGGSTAFFTKLSAKNTRKNLIIFYFLYTIVVILLLFLFISLVSFFNYSDDVFPNIPNEYIYLGVFFGIFTWITEIFIKISDAYAITVSTEMIKIGYKVVLLLLTLYAVYFTAFDLNNYFYIHYFSLIIFTLLLIKLFINKSIFKNMHLFLSRRRFANISKEFITYCSPLVVYNIIGLIAGFLGLWMLQKYGGATQTGFYGLAYGLAAVCFLFVSAMTQIIMREFSKAYGEQNIVKMGEMFSRYIPMLYAVVAYFAVFVSMQSANIIEIFTNDEFKDAFLVLTVMAFYPIHQTYGHLSGSVFYATEQTKLYRNIALFVQPLLVIFSYIFIVELQYGALGFAISMVLTQFIGVNIGLYFNTKFLNLSIKYFIFHQFYTILFFIVIAYFTSIIVDTNSIFLNFLFSGFLYTTLVIIFAYLFPQIFATTRKEINLNLNYIQKRFLS